MRSVDAHFELKDPHKRAIVSARAETVLESAAPKEACCSVSVLFSRKCTFVEDFGEQRVLKMLKYSEKFLSSGSDISAEQDVVTFSRISRYLVHFGGNSLFSSSFLNSCVRNTGDL